MRTLEELALGGCLPLETLEIIEQTIVGNGNFAPERVRQQIEWFCRDLRINRYYFETTPPELIARHIESLRAAEIIAQNSGEEVRLNLASEQANQAIYFVAEEPEATDEVERRIETKYPRFRLQSYLTKGKVHGTPFRLYFLAAPSFPVRQPGQELTFETAVDVDFLRRSPESTVNRYKRGWEALRGKEAPFIHISEGDPDETRIMVTLKRDASRRFTSDFSHVLDTYELHTVRKYVEPYADDKIAFSFYLPRIEDPDIAYRLERDLSAVVIMPTSKLSTLFFQRQFSAQETLYATAVSHFANQFLTSDSEEFQAISLALEGKPEIKGMLTRLKTKLVKDTYTPSRVNETIIRFPGIARLAFEQFSLRFSPEPDEGDPDQIGQQIHEGIASGISWEVERRVMESFLTFNKVVLKTNFFKTDKASLAFRLDSSLLDPIDYPQNPFGIFYLVGKEFRGFHIRFKDVARGGIRLVRSRNEETYDINSDFIFDENYNLASTQQLKNKDIPEGGSKGTILLHFDSQDKAESAFKNYVDGVLDLLMPGGDIVDRYGQQEILFLGPDEGTAELMNWACLRAKERGYAYWKPFTTGKAPSLGGVPHDVHGMTTQGIHEYVLGVLEQLGLEESQVTKIQTGGPDGDLGSNEIRLSKDRTLAVVDGSGVVYDPRGLDRKTLLGLADRRQMVRHFDRSKLSTDGFVVTIEDRDLVLPDGTRVINGEHFRNRFHLLPNITADLFVPCGGRPRSINIGNWSQMLGENGRPRFKAIVEGANLFITQDARLRLEEAGIVLIKDASANKGGVTSSSLEVLASLALNDEEYRSLMMVANGPESEFRVRYVQEIIEKIRANARLEFRALQRERKETGVASSILSDQLSLKINALADAIQRSDLISDPELVRAVVSDYCPRVLVDHLGIETVLQRVPGKYVAAIVAKQMASAYVYQSGLRAMEVDFLRFVEEIRTVGA